MKLEQKQGLKRRYFEIDGDKIKVIYKTSSETKEWTVDIETIGSEKIIETASRKSGIFLGLFFIAFGILFIAGNLADKENTLELWAWIAIALFYVILGGFIFLFPVKREIHLVGGMSQLSFFLDSPSKEEVEKFINFIVDTSKIKLIEKYAKIDPDLPEETMMNQLNWLRIRKLISEDEFTRLKSEYKTRKIIN